MFFIIIAVSLFSSTYQMQAKYDYCKSIEFKGEYCKTQKKLNKYERKTINR